MTNDDLFAWVMHRFSEVFEEHAIIKGGMALRLLDSPRATTDIDYVFVPFGSKKEVLPKIKQVLGELEDAEVTVKVHSKMIRAEVRAKEAAIQIEANVMRECKSIPMATGGFAQSVRRPSQIVRIMQLDVALAHKVAAWNERRLLRDLFDCYFLFGRARAKVDLEVLDNRLQRVQSRLPRLRAKKRMTRHELAEALNQACESLSDEMLQDEVGPLLPPEEFAGLAQRMRTVLVALVEDLLR